MREFIQVATTNELTPGKGKVVWIEKEEIALFNVQGKFYAIHNTCLHRGGPLGEGELQGEVVVCPWHGWEYNVCTGENLSNPAIKVPTYQVKVEGSAVFVKKD